MKIITIIDAKEEEDVAKDEIVDRKKKDEVNITIILTTASTMVIRENLQISRGRGSDHLYNLFDKLLSYKKRA